MPRPTYETLLILRKGKRSRAPACVSCGLTEFQTPRGADPAEHGGSPEARFQVREFFSNWSHLFRALLIVSTTSYLITFFHVYFVADHLQHALAWHGYGAILTLPASITWLSMLLWIASTVGMWLFVRSARFLYTALIAFFVFLLFFSGVTVQTALGSFFGVINMMSDGALLVIAYVSPLKDKFDDMQPNN